MGETPIPVVMRGRATPFSASAAASMSLSMARAKALTMTWSPASEPISLTLRMSPGLDAGKPASNASLDGYSDASEVASWATEAMKWAVENGIIKGTKKDVLSPNGYATRAQVATIIMRFVDM